MQKKKSRSQAQKEHSIATRSGKRRTVCFISELVIRGNLMAVSRHLHASHNYAADYNLCRMHCCIPPGPTGKSSIQPSYIMLQNPKNEMKVILQCSYKQPHPQTKSLNKQRWPRPPHHRTSVWEGQAYKNRKTPESPRLSHISRLRAILQPQLLGLVFGQKLKIH